MKPYPVVDEDEDDDDDDTDDDTDADARRAHAHVAARVVDVAAHAARATNDRCAIVCRSAHGCRRRRRRRRVRSRRLRR
jgi:hypothetical protein